MAWYDDKGLLRPGRPPGSRNRKQSTLPKKKYGSWKVLRHLESRAGHGEAMYQCRCACGTEKAVSGYNLKEGKSLSCGTCQVPEGEMHRQWQGHGDISGDYWYQIWRGSTRAKGRRYNVEFAITIEYAWDLFLKQGRRCAMTGWPLTMSKKQQARTSSLDRIDSKKGYVEGNVQWVHKEVNMMKNKIPVARFVELCKAVATHTTCEM